jgi:hypothetical protein
MRNGRVMDFNVLAQLEWSQPGSGVTLSEHAPLRALVRKVLKMTTIERQRCSIRVGNFTYQRAEIEALARHPDFADADMARGTSAVLRFRPRSVGA